MSNKEEVSSYCEHVFDKKENNSCSSFISFIGCIVDVRDTIPCPVDRDDIVPLNKCFNRWALKQETN